MGGRVLYLQLWLFRGWRKGTWGGWEEDHNQYYLEVFQTVRSLSHFSEILISPNQRWQPLVEHRGSVKPLWTESVMSFGWIKIDKRWSRTAFPFCVPCKIQISSEFCSNITFSLKLYLLSPGVTYTLYSFELFQIAIIWSFLALRTLSVIWFNLLADLWAHISLLLIPCL